MTCSLKGKHQRFFRRELRKPIGIYKQALLSVTPRYDGVKYFAKASGHEAVRSQNLGPSRTKAAGYSTWDRYLGR